MIKVKDLPEKVLIVLATFNENENLLAECKRLEEETAKLGWKLEYRKDGEPTDIREFSKDELLERMKIQYVDISLLINLPSSN